MNLAEINVNYGDNIISQGGFIEVNGLKADMFPDGNFIFCRGTFKTLPEGLEEGKVYVKYTGLQNIKLYNESRGIRLSDKKAAEYNVHLVKIVPDMLKGFSVTEIHVEDAEFTKAYVKKYKQYLKLQKTEGISL